MKIQIASDLHLEFPENKEFIRSKPLIPSAEVLLLAGDIVFNINKSESFDFFHKVEMDFPLVISTMGNHEFYYDEIDYAYPNFFEKNGNFYILNNRTHIYKNVRFVVSTMWTNVDEEDRPYVSSHMNDFQLIFKNVDGKRVPISVDDTNEFFRISKNFLEKELSNKFEGKTVVMTHHLPSVECVSEKYKNDKLNPAYASNLDEFIKDHPEINLWVSGHSHEFHDIFIGNTRIVRNPLGYLRLKENAHFFRDFVVEI